MPIGGQQDLELVTEGRVVFHDQNLQAVRG